MATILMTWELGGGMGHLMRLRPVGQELVKRGHRVIAAIRDLQQVGELFEGTGIAFVPAPIRVKPGPPPFPTAASYAQLLANVGFGEARSLQTVFGAWQTLLDLIQPDLVIADHSPSALLALRGRGVPCVNMGLGFFAPPESFPLPHWLHTLRPGDMEILKRDELAVLAKVNALLESKRRPVLSQLSNLYTQVTDTVLATYEEFDHFGPRAGVRYWGHWPHGVGKAFTWPAGPGKKVFAYVKGFAGLEGLLRALHEWRMPTVVFAPGQELRVLQRFASPSLHFEMQPVDLKQVAAECDLALLNANHGTAATVLLSGKPCVLFPQYSEQLAFARKVEALGAAKILPPMANVDFSGALQSMAEDGVYREKAQQFADKYKDAVPGAQLTELVVHVEGLIKHR